MKLTLNLGRGLLLAALFSLMPLTASGAPIAAFEQEAIIDNSGSHGGTIQAISGDLLDGLLPTSVDQGWPAITNTDRNDILTDGVSNVGNSFTRFIGGEPSTTDPLGNHVDYDLGGTFDIDSVAVIASWTDRTGQAWDLSVSTNGGATFNSIFVLNGLDDDGFVSGFTNSVVNRVTVSDDGGGPLATGVTNIRVQFLADDINWNVYREIDVVEFSASAVPEPTSVLLLGVTGLILGVRRRR